MKSFWKRMASLCTAMLLLLLCAVPKDSLTGVLTAEAAELASVSAKSIETKETYTMRIWLAHQEMGDEVESRTFYNDELFFCYHVKDSSGALVTSGLDFTVTETIIGPSGSAVWTKTHSSDERDTLWGWLNIYGSYNYTSYAATAYGIYTFKAVMYLKGSSEPFITCSIDYTVKQFSVGFKRYVSLSEFGDAAGDAMHPIERGSDCYVCYELYDKDNNEPIGDRRIGYTVTIKVIKPDGTVFDTEVATNEDQHYECYTIYTRGKWTAEFTLDGTMQASTQTITFYIDPLSAIIDNIDQTYGADKFIWGTDNWRFGNDDEFFTTGYDVNDTVMQRLLEYTNPTNIDREITLRMPYYQNLDEWGGSCYGMTVMEMFRKQGILDLKKDIGLNSILHENENTDDVLSAINFFYMLQCMPSVRQVSKYSLDQNKKIPQSELIAALDKAIEADDCYVNICIRIVKKSPSGEQLSTSGHSVLGYGKQTGTFYINGKTYDRRILIADPNHLDWDKLDDNCCLYYDSADGSWCYPNENYVYSSGNIDCCFWDAESELDFSNGMIKNLLVYQSPTDVRDLRQGVPDDGSFYSEFYIYNSTLDTDDSYMISYSGGSQVMPEEPYIKSFNEDSQLYYDSWYLTPYNESRAYHYYNRTSGSYSYNTGDFDFMQNYRNHAYFGKLKNVTEMYLHPLGYIEISGDSLEYDVDLVANEGYCPTDWYSVSVSGQGASHLIYQKHEEGYLIKGDNLKNVTVSAYNQKASASATFTTYYSSALIYEIDETTIGVKVDTDDDGDYETVITEITTVAGDANNDGKLSMQDAVLLYRYLAEDESISPALTKIVAKSKKTDLDEDGVITLLDLKKIISALTAA